MKKSYLLIIVSFILFSCNEDDMDTYRKELSYIFFNSSRDNSTWAAEETIATYYKYKDYCSIYGSTSNNQRFHIFIDKENIKIGEIIKDFRASHNKIDYDLVFWSYNTQDNAQNDSYLILEEFDTINNIIKGKFKLVLKNANRDEDEIIKLTNGEFKADLSISDMRDTKILLTQQEVNEFGARNLINFNGRISIGDDDINNPNSLITDLSPLNSLKTVERISIRNTSLTNLNGLHNIESMAHFGVANNPYLLDLSALSKCNVTNSMSIHNNDSLTGLNGLSETTFIGVKAIYISENDLLENLGGLENITTIDYGGSYTIVSGKLFIINNNSLISLDGLNNLLNIEKELLITGNPLLTDFCGIQSLFNNGFNAEYRVSENAFNPTQQDLIDGNCSQ